TVAEDPDDQGADERTEHAPATAEQACPAHDDGGNAVEVARLAGLGVADAGSSYQDQGGDPIQQTGGRVDAEQDPTRPNTREPRRIRIVPGRIPLTPGAAPHPDCARSHTHDARRPSWSARTR